MLFDLQAALAEILTTPLATPATIATNLPDAPSLSQLSRLSQGATAETRTSDPVASLPLSTRADINRAMRAGCQTPGAIASYARLGVTLTYQELDRMAQAGLTTMQPNGALHLTAAAAPTLRNPVSLDPPVAPKLIKR